MTINFTQSTCVTLADRLSLPHKPGVYVVVCRGMVLYVGETRNFHNRWHAHHKENVLRFYGSDQELRIHCFPMSKPQAWLQEPSFIHELHPLLNRAQCKAKRYPKSECLYANQ